MEALGPLVFSILVLALIVWLLFRRRELPCSQERPSQGKEYVPAALQPRAEGRLKAPWDQDGFALELFREVKRGAPQQNVFMSPVGLAVSLLLLDNGARGETRTEIERCLGLKEPAREELNRGVSALIREIKAVTNLELELANSIWVHEQADLLPEFEKDAQAHFEADVEKADFHSATTSERMKAWVVKKARGKIAASSGGIDPQAWITILNTAYFRGNWLDPFDPKETSSEAFTRSDGLQKKVPMMFRKGYFFFVAGRHFTGVSLPYRGNRFRMVVLLPERGSLDEFIEDLNPADWKSQQAYFGYGFVKMPRFRLECEARLEENLPKLGLTSLFDPGRADFSGIVRPPASPYVGGLRHSTTCEVDEWGTVAAAFADLKLVGGPTELVANRPFLFSIQEFETNFILFLGAVEDPG
jgi:serpin B